jgi:hypothetical protein
VNHRIVTVSVTAVLAIFAIAALLFAGAIQARLPFTPAEPRTMPIPHPVEAADSDCSECHTIGERSLPVTHRNYSQDTCRSCHRLSPPTLITHDDELGETGCPLCHGDPSRDLGMPRDHLDYPPGQCTFCHRVSPNHADVSPRRTGSWLTRAPQITHPVEGVFEECVRCHEVDGTPPMPDDHERFEPQTCLWCHDPAPAESD